MNNRRRRLALWLVFLATGFAFDQVTNDLPSGKFYALLYYGGAASVDLFMLRIIRYFVAAHLQRDVEAICFASIVTNALGWALYLAKTQPDIYNFLIQGLNYVLAVRLLIGEGDVSNPTHGTDRGGVVRRAFDRCAHHMAKEAK